MNFAVIPWSKNELNDYIFYSIDDRGVKSTDSNSCISYARRV